MTVGEYIAGSNGKASMKDLKQKSWDNKYKEQVKTSREIYAFDISYLLKELHNTIYFIR